MKRSRSTTLEPIGLVIMRETGLRPPSMIETSPVAARDWEAAVGSRIAARAQPVRLDRGVLVVRTASSTWAQELALLSEPILAQLRARGLPVDSLRFRVGHVDAPERPPQRDEVRTAPRSAPLPPEVRAELARVEDAELRDAIARAAAKNLGWQMEMAAPRKGANARKTATSGRGGSAPTPITSAPSGARGPRSAGTESAPPGRASRPAPGASRGKP